MELYNRKDFIQIDYREGNFQAVCVTKILSADAQGNEELYFDIMQKFKENLEECIKFTIGAMSAIRLFKNEDYKPVDYIEIRYTEDAKKRIMSKKYRVAEYTYPDITALKGAWKLSQH